MRLNMLPTYLVLPWAHPQEGCVTYKLVLTFLYKHFYVQPKNETLFSIR